MKTFLISSTIALCILIPPVEAHGYEGNLPKVYKTEYPLVAGLLGIAAGTATWHIDYPPAIPGPGTYYVGITVGTSTAAANTLLLFGAGMFSSPGCTVGTLVVDLAFISSVTGYVPVTVTSGTSHCTISLRLQLQISVTMVNLAGIRPEISMSVPENYRLNYLCDATGDTSESFSHNGDPCNDPNINVPDVATAIATLCNGTESEPCVVQVNGINATGNNTVTVEDRPGFDGSLYILLMVIVFAFAHLGELRKDNIYRIIAGFISLVAGFVVIWELDRLGFNSLGVLSLWFAVVWVLIQTFFSFYLMVPKNWQEHETQ